MTTDVLQIDPIEQVLAAYARGEIVIIADDVDRENEGANGQYGL